MANTETSEEVPIYKVVITGQVGVGKTTLLYWIQNNKFVDVTQVTTPPPYVTKSLNAGDTKIKVNCEYQFVYKMSSNLICF